MAVQQDEFVEVAEEQAEAEESEEELMSLSETFDASQGLVEKSMMNPQTGTIQDEYTKIYMPVSFVHTSSWREE